MTGAIDIEPAGLLISVLLGVADEEAASPGPEMPRAEEWELLPEPAEDPDLCLYRWRTLRLLRRYLRLSVEAGRLPSLLGRELFETTVTETTVASFEDRVIFVHDVERSLEKLDFFSRSVVEAVVLQDYSQAEAAEVLGCRRRTVVRCYPEALDRLSEILLKGGLLERLPGPGRGMRAGAAESCQGAEKGVISVSYSNDGRNKVGANVSFTPLNVL